MKRPDQAGDGLSASRRRLFADTLGIAISGLGFGVVYGLAARAGGLSPVEAGAMSVLVFAGAAQFAALGYLREGLPWVTIALLTAFINARHLLYGAVLAPYLADRRPVLRVLMAHVLDDETFALSIAHFRRIGRVDLFGYWFAALGGTFVPWIATTLVGVIVGASIPAPERFGLDVTFPAAMAGLAVGLITGYGQLAAALIGAAAAVTVSLIWDPAVGILAGGLLGPLAALAIPTDGGSHSHSRGDQPALVRDGSGGP